MPEPFQREPDPRQRYKLTLAYEGTAFHGWQKQTTPEGDVLRTVCGVTEASIVHALQQPITLVGASRTDAGVHARGQMAHFNAETTVPLERMCKAINSRLPGDVEAVHCEPADASFDAISDATSKQYRYRIFNTRRRPLELRHVVNHIWWPLDVDRMNAAATRLVGTHDVEGFAQASHGRTTTVRTIFDCHVETAETTGPEVQIVISGSGFLYNMVRIVAGTLVEVGRGHWEPTVIDDILASRDRRKAGPTLPPNGLWLEWIRYK